MSKRSTFVAALGGVLVGTLLVGAVPAVAGIGDALILGKENNGGAKTTEITAKVANGPALKVTNTAGDSKAAMRINTDGTAPPFATNSTRRVLNFNADRLDGADARDLRVVHRSTYDANPSDVAGAAVSLSLNAPTDGVLQLQGKIDVVQVGNDNTSCRLAVNSDAVVASQTNLVLDQGQRVPCTAMGSVAVTKGPQNIDLWMLGVGDNWLYNASMQVTFIPKG